MDVKNVMSSIHQDWATPQWFVDLVKKKFNTKLKLDVCCYPETSKCKKYFTEEDNALIQEWDKNFWMNPPYGRSIPEWLEYAYNQSKKHNKIGVCLIPSRTDTQWFHDFACKGKIVFMKGRLGFERNGVKTTGDIDLPQFSTWEWKNELISKLENVAKG